MNSLSNYHFSGRVTKILGAKTLHGDLLFEFTVKQEVGGNEQTLTCVVAGGLAKILGPNLRVGDHVCCTGNITWRNEYNNVPMSRVYYCYINKFIGDKPITKKTEITYPEKNERVIWDE